MTSSKGQAGGMNPTWYSSISLQMTFDHLGRGKSKKKRNIKKAGFKIKSRDWYSGPGYPLSPSTESTYINGIQYENTALTQDGGSSL